VKTARNAFSSAIQDDLNTAGALGALFELVRATNSAIDAGELPCRPCDQRVCAPGDFRCLTRIPPDRVVEAAIRCLDA
jgi:cysteinyl-tRNA synthetase